MSIVKSVIPPRKQAQASSNQKEQPAQSSSSKPTEQPKQQPVDYVSVLRQELRAFSEIPKKPV